MTYQEMAEDAWDSFGRNTDLPIYATPNTPTTFDWALTGSTKILRYIRNAELSLASAIDKRGKKLIWKHLCEHRYFKFAHLFDGTAFTWTTKAPGITGAFNQEDPPTTGSFTDPFGNVPKMYLSLLATEATVANRINTFLDNASLKDYVLTITAGAGAGQSRLIVDSALVTGALVCAINKDWDTLPDATSRYKLYRNWIGFNEVAVAYSGFYNLVGTPQSYEDNLPLSTVTQLDTVLKIVEMENGSEIEYGFSGDSYDNIVQGTPSTPAAWAIVGNRIVFDSLVDPSITFKFECVMKPRVFVPATDAAIDTLNRPDFPEQWHQVILAKVIEKLFCSVPEPEFASYWGSQYDNQLIELQNDGSLLAMRMNYGRIEVDNGN
jgi:hypothetical protein